MHYIFGAGQEPALGLDYREALAAPEGEGPFSVAAGFIKRPVKTPQDRQNQPTRSASARTLPPGERRGDDMTQSDSRLARSVTPRRGATPPRGYTPPRSATPRNLTPPRSSATQRDVTPPRSAANARGYPQAESNASFKLEAALIAAADRTPPRLRYSPPARSQGSVYSAVDSQTRGVWSSANQVTMGGTPRQDDDLRF